MQLALQLHLHIDIIPVMHSWQRPTTEDQQRWRGRTASNLDIDTQAPSSYATSRNESEYWATSVMTSSNGLAVDSF